MMNRFLVKRGICLVTRRMFLVIRWVIFSDEEDMFSDEGIFLVTRRVVFTDERYLERVTFIECGVSSEIFVK